MVFLHGLSLQWFDIFWSYWDIFWSYGNTKKVNRFQFSFKRENILDIDIENKYDKIFSFETIEHFEPNEIKKILNIFNKALKPGGYLIFSTPYNQEDSSASRKWHKTFHITENTIIEMVEGLFTIDKFYYQNYNHHDLTEDLPFKHFIICVAKKI